MSKSVHTKPRKPSKCKVCRSPYQKRSMTHKVCSATCAMALAVSERAKKERREAIKDRAETKRKLEAHKPLEFFLKKAEAACNEYIRYRDPDICISCKVTYSTAWQAGHFISVGANKTLRYNEDNIHKQCLQCNLFKGSNAIEYEKNLEEKIGIERVEFLKSWHSPVKMTREAAQEIEAMYKGKLKELKASSSQQ